MRLFFLVATSAFRERTPSTSNQEETIEHAQIVVEDGDMNSRSILAGVDVLE